VGLKNYQVIDRRGFSIDTAIVHENCQIGLSQGALERA